MKTRLGTSNRLGMRLVSQNVHNPRIAYRPRYYGLAEDNFHNVF